LVVTPGFTANFRTSPLIDYYEQESLLRRISGTGSIDSIQKQIITILQGTTCDNS